MITPITVLAPGTHVRIGLDISATIIGVWLLDGGSVQYSVTWFDGCKRMEAWFYASEFTVVGEVKKLPIGFGRPAAD